MSNRTFQCDGCFQIFDRLYIPEIKYDGDSFCPNCFGKELREAQKVFYNDGLMLTVRASTFLDEPEEIAYEEVLDVLTYRSYKDFNDHPEALMV